MHRGWVKGLRAQGVEVVDYNLGDRLRFYTHAMLEVDGELRNAFQYEAACELAAKGLESVCYEWWPDIVIVVSGFFVPPSVYKVMRARKHHVVLLCTESPYEDNRQVMMADSADTVILNDPTNLDEFLDYNPRTIYVPHGYDPEVHKPGPVRPELASDFAFVGTGYPSRIEFLEQVGWGDLNVRLEGHWREVRDNSPLRPFCPTDLTQCIDNSDAVDIYRSTKVSANLYRKEAGSPELAEGWSVGPREVELAACGTFFLREPRGEGDELFPMLPTVTSPADFGEQVQWWATHDSERLAAAELARKAVADRTFDANAARLLSHINA